MQVLTFSELSKRWKISRRSIERGVKRGEFPQSMRIGGSLRFPLHAVEEFERRQSGDVPEADAAQDRLDEALASIGDKLLSSDGQPGSAAWSTEEAREYRDLLAGLESLSESGRDRLTELCHGHAVDPDHLELHATAIRLHARAKPIADELKARRSALNELPPTCRVGLGTIDESVLQAHSAGRNAISAAKDASRVVSYLGCLYPWLFNVAPTVLLEPRIGLVSRLVNRARELGLDGELLDALQGETSDDEPEVDTGPAVPWWQCRKNDTGDKPTTSQERAMSRMALEIR